MNKRIKDRGTKKWTSIMYPEYVKGLRKLNEELNKEKRPILDEQKIWENEVKLQMALHNSLTVELKLYNDGHFVDVQGKILLMDSVNKSVRLANDDLEYEQIKFNDIVDVTVL